MLDIKLKNSFDSDGFVFCRSFRSLAQIEESLANLERLIRETVPGLPPELVYYEDKSNRESLKQIQQLQLHDEYFARLMTEGPFRELAEQLLGSEVVCKNMQYFNKPPGTGQPTPAHQDGHYFKLDRGEALTLWLALDPVDEENGCVRYVPKSHLQGLRPHGSTETLGFSQGITDFPNESDRAFEIALPAQPGDLLAHHAYTIHRAEGNKSRTRSRRALGFIYYSVNAKEDLVAWRAYQDELKNRLAESGKI